MRETYTSVPKDVIDLDTDYWEKMVRLKRFLQARPGIFFKAKVLAETIGYPSKGTQVELRKAVTDLIENWEAPIVVNARGFAFACHVNQIDVYIESLQARINGVQARINALRKIRDKFEVR